MGLDPAVVVLDDLDEGGEAAVVHVGRGDGGVAERGRLEEAVVEGVAGDVADAVVVLDRAGVEAVVERLDRLEDRLVGEGSARAGRRPGEVADPAGASRPRKIALPWFSAAVKLGG